MAKTLRPLTKAHHEVIETVALVHIAEKISKSSPDGAGFLKFYIDKHLKPKQKQIYSELLVRTEEIAADFAKHLEEHQKSTEKGD